MIGLCGAIYIATLEELADNGFEQLSFDRIAARAGAGKASLYRRWRSPAELVLDALTDPLTGFGDPLVPDTGSLRLDLIAVLTNLAEVLNEPRGRALRPLLTQRPRHPQLFDEVFRRVAQPLFAMLLHVLQRATDRHGADPRAVTERIAAVGPQLVIMAHMQSAPLPRSEIEAIVDEVILPLVGSLR
ncbi:TetR/AcrR family transcriptional regulator [Mycobacterium sp.]|uniref:TetR/AcrR family transcriptional regulator n=1 Tax=Mycobacterium sp. TaxID=1785 RepID=UPI0039C97A5A